MSYVDRMSWRMMGPALTPIVLGGAAAWLLSTLLDLPLLLGGQVLLADLPFQAVMIGAGMSLGMIVYQILRFWRWTRGKGPACYVCGCLLGRMREGRYGTYRKCLGCGKNHSLARGLV
jgi:hypothetical protein